MKPISFSLVALLLAVASLPAQDQSVVEAVNRQGVYVQELLADRAQMKKQMADLTREMESLREQLAAVRGSASQQDCCEVLADSIREVDRKRQKDRELILDEIDKLGKKLGARAPSAGGSSVPPSSSERFEYVVREGDTLSAIVEAYRREGVKVTLNDVLRANPGLKPESMQIGQKVIIPKP